MVADLSANIGKRGDEKDMIRIFISDDHTIVRDGLRRILSEEKDIMVVGEATDGRETIRLLRCCEWDILMLDISMPNMGGLEVLTKIHRNYPKKQVLILTQYEEAHLALRFLKAGALGYLTKMEAAEELVKAVRRVASGKRYVTHSIAEELIGDLNMEDAPRHTMLSNREFNVMSRIAAGMSLSVIADEFNLSVSTVSTYRRRILDKIKLRNNAEITRYALEKKILS